MGQCYQPELLRQRLIVSRFSISTAACDVDMLANEEGEGVQEGEVAINVDDAIEAAEAGNGWRGNKVPPIVTPPWHQNTKPSSI